MEKAQNLANDRYKELCAQFGDLTIRLQGMQKDLENLLKQIHSLNDHVPVLHQLEEQILAQIKADQAKFAQADTAKPVQKLDNITNLVDDPRGPKK